MTYTKFRIENYTFRYLDIPFTLLQVKILNSVFIIFEILINTIENRKL